MAKLMADRRHEVTQRRKEVLLHLIEQGMSVLEALPDPRVGVSYSAYRKWKQTDKAWAAKVNIARATSERIVAHSETGPNGVGGSQGLWPNDALSGTWAGFPFSGAWLARSRFIPANILSEVRR